MKQLLLALTVAAAGWLGTTTPAEAGVHGHRRIHTTVWVGGYIPCGVPVCTERVFIGYGRYGYPVYQTRVLPVVRHFHRHAPCYGWYGRWR